MKKKLARILTALAIFLMAILLLLPYAAARVIERSIGGTEGLIVEIAGIGIGRSISVNSITATLPGTAAPFIKIHNAVISPQWKTLMSGAPVIADLNLAEAAVTWNDSAAKWWSSRSSKSAPRRDWLLESASVGKACVIADMGEWCGSVVAAGVTPSGANSAQVHIQEKESASSAILALNRDPAGLNASAQVNLESIGKFLIDARAADTAIRLSGVFEIDRVDFAIRGGSIELSLDPENNYAVRPGSQVSFDEAGMGGETISKVAAQFAGDFDSGYSISIALSEARWSTTIFPSVRTLVIEAAGRLPSIRNLREPAINGRFTVTEAADGSWEAIGAGDLAAEYLWAGRRISFATEFAVRVFAANSVPSTPEVESPAAPYFWIFRLGRFLSTSARDLRARSFTLEARNTSASGKHGGKPWSIRIPALAAARDASNNHIDILQTGIVVFAEKSYPVSGGISVDYAGRATLRNAAFAEIPFSAEIELPDWSFERATIEIPPVSITSISKLLPTEFSELLTRSTINGEFSAGLNYTKENNLDGEVRVNISELIDPITGFEIRNLKAAIPVRQRFVDPDSVEFDETTRYPDLPFSVFADRVGRYDIAAEDIKGKAIFSGYVFRLFDLTYSILGSNASTRLVLDPFRSPDGKIRTILEIEARTIPLKRIYTAYVGKGKAAETLEGELSVFFQSQFSDFHADTVYGQVKSLGHGVISAPVIEKLNGMRPARERLPFLGLAVLGSYRYDDLDILIWKPPTIEEIVLRLTIASPREMTLKKLGLVAPLRAVIEGLPFDVKAEIRGKRKQ